MDRKPAFTTIDEYIAAFPDDDIQQTLRQLRATILAAAPEATEKISYQMPTFAYKGTLVHFAAYPKHIGFYPSPSGIAAFQEEISAYRWSKGSVQFPLSEPLPLDLISRIVRFRVEENERKAAEKVAKRKK